jgi:phage-related protein
MSNLYFNAVGDVADSLCPFNADTLVSSLIYTAANPILPSYSSILDVPFSINEVAFGDGYSQRSMMGLNFKPRKFNLVFAQIRNEVATALKNFFEGSTSPSSIYYRSPNEWFWYYLPAPYSEWAKFVASNLSIGFDQYDSYTVKVTFQEVFDLADPT